MTLIRNFVVLASKTLETISKSKLEIWEGRRRARRPWAAANWTEGGDCSRRWISSRRARWEDAEGEERVVHEKKKKRKRKETEVGGNAIGNGRMIGMPLARDGRVL